MKYGYARETGNNDLSLQLSELSEFGCHSINSEEVNQGRVLAKLLDTLSSGDVIVVWRFDKLADSVSELDRIVTKLKTLKISLYTIVEKYDSRQDNGFTQRLIHDLAKLCG